MKKNRAQTSSRSLHVVCWGHSCAVVVCVCLKVFFVCFLLVCASMLECARRSLLFEKRTRCAPSR